MQPKVHVILDIRQAPVARGAGAGDVGSGRKWLASPVRLLLLLCGACGLSAGGRDSG